jgi:hypothetical protein
MREQPGSVPPPPRMLVINRKLRVANDVDEQDMGDFELDLFLNLNGHLCRAR